MVEPARQRRGAPVAPMPLGHSNILKNVRMSAASACRPADGPVPPAAAGPSCAPHTTHCTLLPPASSGGIINAMTGTIQFRIKHGVPRNYRPAGRRTWYECPPVRKRICV